MDGTFKFVALDFMRDAFHGELMRVVPAPGFCEIAVTSFIRPGMMRRCGMLGPKRRRSDSTGQQAPVTIKERKIVG